jgi:hypothetical protein
MPKKAVHFFANLDFGEGFDLASELDDKKRRSDLGDFGIRISCPFFARQTVWAFLMIRKRGRSGSEPLEKDGLRLLR